MKTFLNVGLIVVIAVVLVAALFGLFARIEDTYFADDAESVETLDFGDESESDAETETETETETVTETETEWTGTPDGEPVYYAAGFVNSTWPSHFYVDYDPGTDAWSVDTALTADYWDENTSTADGTIYRKSLTWYGKAGTTLTFECNQRTQVAFVTSTDTAYWLFKTYWVEPGVHTITIPAECVAKNVTVSLLYQIPRE